MIGCWLGDTFWGFVLPVLESSSALWCAAADTHLKLLDRLVSGACFLTVGVFECDMHIVDLWQCVLHAVLSLHIYKRLSLLDVEDAIPHTGPLFTSQYISLERSC